MTGPRCISAAQVAERCGVSVKTLARWRKVGYGPAWLALGRRCVYEPADVEAFLASRRQSAGAA